MGSIGGVGLNRGGVEPTSGFSKKSQKICGENASDPVRTYVFGFNIVLDMSGQKFRHDFEHFQVFGAGFALKIKKNQ